MTMWPREARDLIFLGMCFMKKFCLETVSVDNKNKDKLPRLYNFGYNIYPFQTTMTMVLFLCSIDSWWYQSLDNLWLTINWCKIVGVKFRESNSKVHTIMSHASSLLYYIKVPKTVPYDNWYLSYLCCVAKRSQCWQNHAASEDFEEEPFLESS